MANLNDRRLTPNDILISEQPIRFDAPLQAELTKTFSDAKLQNVIKTARKITVRKIEYRSNGHKVVGFMVEPKHLTKKTPCIIWNRGGSGEFGALNLGQVFSLLGMFALWGYIVIASQYSGNGGSEGKDEHGGADLNDVLVLPQVLALHPFADTKNIGMFGGSRGGMMTYLCLTRASWIKAAVVVAGLADLTRQTKLRPKMLPVFKDMFGGKSAELKKRSATLWANKFPKNTPLLIMHGSADERVTPQDSLDLSTNLLAAGVHHRMVLFENGDHDLSQHRSEKWALTKQWFATHLP